MWGRRIERVLILPYYLRKVYIAKDNYLTGLNYFSIALI